MMDGSGADRARFSVAHVAFAGGNGFPPEDTGGVQSSTDDLARRLLARGDKVTVLAPLYGHGWFGFAARAKLKIGGGLLARDRRHGYDVFRAWFPEAAVSEFVDIERPNVAVVQCHNTVPIAKAFRRRGVPVVIYFRNVEFNELGGSLDDLQDAQFIANSQFTADACRAKFGVEATIIPPTLQAERYRVLPVGRQVTLINPVKSKGLDLAISLAAACPDIPFLFQESWLLAPRDRAELEAAIQPYNNIRFARRTQDIRAVYAQTRVLLAPSLWAEAWGRVASEAQVSGIPVLGSTSGGLPEAIGPGGVTLDYAAGPDVWAAALRRIWDDPHRYAVVSAAAKSHAMRPEMDPDHQFSVFRSVLQRALS
ncbi:MAG: glycosyltransferase [Pseudomonadota bacterium]